MIKKIIPFLFGFGILIALFTLLSHPPEPSINNSTESQNSAAVTITPTSENAENGFVDPHQDSPVYDDPDLVFFWGDGCPHCENVEDWINQSEAETKLKINFKEIYYSEENRNDLLEIVEEYCPELVSNGSIGVPTAFDPVGKQCIQGDTPIISFLASKLSE